MAGKGAIACGHPATAAAAREILDDGGNAFDAALAGLCAATVAEPVFCSLAGGGYLLAHRADGAPQIYDFFVETPRRRRPQADIDFTPVLADFGTATQEFHIGLGAIATPGVVAGLFAAHTDLGNLPVSRLVEPAVRLARDGVTLRPIDGYIFQIVGRILTARPEGRALFMNGERHLLATGDQLHQPDLAATLEALAAEGPALFYEGELGQRLVADCRAHGGQITDADLAGYEVVKRAPLEGCYRDARILTNPPPSSGGILIAFALALLERIDLGLGGAGSAEHLGALARAMELTNKARVESQLHQAMAENEEEAAAARLFDPALLARYAQEILPHPCSPRPHSPRGTTHISVVDAAGNIAALSVSNGEGCGYILPGTGIMLNNMLGEEDLSPQGFHVWPKGCRMSSMMAPTIAFRDDGRIAALGSGGSNRIRTAILQVLINLIDFGMSAEEAVSAPRLHIENQVANLEDGIMEAAAKAATALTEQTVRWPAHNLFFGGVHTVTRDADGRCSGAGDPRRGGAAVIVLD